MGEAFKAVAKSPLGLLDLPWIFVGVRTKNGYRQSFAHRLLKPRSRSGSDVNGRGETTFRRPSPVYHFRETPGVKLGFKWVQQLFYSRMIRHPAFHERIHERKSNIGRDLPDPAAEKVEDTPENWTRKVKAFALEHEADMVGITEVREEWVYEGFDVKLPWIIMEGVVQDYDKIATAPDHTTNMEVLDQYNRAHRANFDLAQWIREQGYQAERYRGFLGTTMTMIPPAIEAGLGILGKHGSMINSKHGPSFRLGYVMTDMPLIADMPDDSPVDDFCMSCQVCTRECPTGAISDEKQWVRGEKKWYVDIDKCLPFFNDTFGCNVCIAVCPFSRPGAAEPLLLKLARRRARKLGETTPAE
ncbi:MAG: 4Fe-4S dicluster domain-containing protein [Hyphomonadaceae bacterium]|nr:4Fe-4S dicluster domain-containing protein [Hyphomonadaceae bacterium]